MAGVGLRLTFSSPTSADGRLGGELGLLRAVHGRGIAPLVAPLGDLRAEARGDVARDLLDLPLDHVLHRLLEGADGAAQHAFLRDDVPGVAGMDLRGRDDRGVHRIDVARHDRLQRRHDVRAHHDRIDAVMRHGAVRAHALHHDLEDVVGGHHRAGPHREAADRDARHVVHAVDALDRELLEQPLLDHDAAAALVLLGGLEDEIDGAVEVLGLGEILGGAQQHHRVAVMAAGMHLAGDRRFVIEVVGLVHVERVHVGAQADRALAKCPSAARRPRRSWPARGEPPCRTASACRRRCRRSALPRRPSRDGCECHAARRSCPYGTRQYG